MKILEALRGRRTVKRVWVVRGATQEKWLVGVHVQDAPDEELERLCVAVIQEKDPAKFTKLVEALNQFLQRKEQARKASAGALCAKPSDARTA